MAQFQNVFTGRFTKSGFIGGTLKCYKEGPWDECAIALNGLVRVPEYIKAQIPIIAATIIVPALQDHKNAGDFAPNTDVTVSIKGNLPPWNGGTGVTGSATMFQQGNGAIVQLSGDQQIVEWVNYGFGYSWGGPVEGRDLFGQTWNDIEEEVKSAVDNALATAMGRL